MSTYKNDNNFPFIPVYLFVCAVRLLVILFVAFQQQQTAKLQSALWWTVIAWLKSVFSHLFFTF